MGSTNQVCSCLFKKSEQNNYAIEIENKIESSFVNYSPRKNLLAKKAFPTKLNMKELKNNSIDNNVIDVSNIINKDITYSYDEDISKTTRPNINSIIKLQATIKAYLFKIKYKNKLKNNLQEKTKLLIENYKTRYKVSLAYQAESIKGLFDKNALPKGYGKDNLPQNKAKPKLLNTFILVYKDNSYYIGTVNILNQRCGLGVLISNRGEKYEGNWLDDIFTGWGRYIDKDGNLFEGNNFYYFRIIYK